MNGSRVLILVAATAALVAALFAAPASAEEQVPESVEPAVAAALAATAEDEMITVIVRFEDQPSPADLAVVKNARGAAKRSERAKVIAALKNTAKDDQQALVQAVQAEIGQGKAGRVTPFWIINGAAVTATPEVIELVAALPGVEVVSEDQTYVPHGSILPATEPNIASTNAPLVWATGLTGEGVVIGAMDSGADIDGVPGVFPAPLADSWRGGTNSWFDPYGLSTNPYDLTGHGTGVLGLAVGGGDATNFGMAPDATWIAAKIFDDSGVATSESVHAAYQWMLDPDGNPATDDGADIINSSWGSAIVGCDSEFAGDIAVMRAFGVLPVFSAGNLGPVAGINSSPANLFGAFSVGAVESDNSIWSSSSRGPNACFGTTFPTMVAPGVGVTTATTFGQMVSETGTSFAAPHVTGAAALLIEADPDISLEELEAALTVGAIDLGAPGVDNDFGHGLLDAWGAYAELEPGSLTMTVVETSGGSTDGVRVRLIAPGPDAMLGTADDAFVSDAPVIGGQAVFDPVGAGHHRLELDPATLPAGSTVEIPAFIDVDLEAGDDLTPGTLSFSAPPIASDNVFLSTRGPGQIPGGVRYRDEDVLKWDGQTLSLYIDGSDVGLGGVDIDAMTRVADDAFLISLDRPETLPDVGFVDDSDVVLLSLTSTGANTAGTYTLFLDGSDVGLTTGAADIDGIFRESDDSILVSIVGSVVLPDIGRIRDEDVARLVLSSSGATTAGTWELVFDGSEQGLEALPEDIDAFALSDTGSLLLSTVGDLDTPSLNAKDHDIVECADLNACSYEIWLRGAKAKVGKEDIDALAVDL